MSHQNCLAPFALRTELGQRLVLCTKQTCCWAKSVSCLLHVRSHMQPVYRELSTRRAPRKDKARRRWGKHMGQTRDISRTPRSHSEQSSPAFRLTTNMPQTSKEGLQVAHNPASKFPALPCTGQVSLDGSCTCRTVYTPNSNSATWYFSARVQADTGPSNQSSHGHARGTCSRWF